MQIKSKVVAEHRTAAHQHFQTRAISRVGLSKEEFSILVPGFSCCCDGCSSCSSGW
jgi:hypothetical protein